MAVTGEVSVDVDSKNGGYCLTGVLGWNGGRPMSRVGETISVGVAAVTGVAGVDVGGTGAGGRLGLALVAGVHKADGGMSKVVGRFISFFIQGWLRHSLALILLSGCLSKRRFMKSIASGEMSSNNSAGKSSSPREI